MKTHTTLAIALCSALCALPALAQDGEANIDTLFLQNHRPAAAVVTGVALLDL